MQKHDSLRLEMQPGLGLSVLGVTYTPTNGIADVTASLEDRPMDHAPLPSPEILARLDQILVEIEVSRRQAALFTGRRVGAISAQTDMLALQQTVLLLIVDEVRALRADLASRTLAARTRRAWAWLKGLF